MARVGTNMRYGAEREGSGTLLFREVQTWRATLFGPMLLVAGVGLVLGFGYAMFEQLILGKAVGERPAPDLVLTVLGILMTVLGGGLVFLVLRGALVTEVRTNALYVQHYPLTRLHCFAYTDIEQYQGRTYRPIREYGGWGVRKGLFGRGKALNVSGNRGVQLVFRDGRKFLIGSRRADELARAIAVAKRDGR